MDVNFWLQPQTEIKHITLKKGTYYITITNKTLETCEEVTLFFHTLDPIHTLLQACTEILAEDEQHVS